MSTALRSSAVRRTLVAATAVAIGAAVVAAPSALAGNDRSGGLAAVGLHDGGRSLATFDTNRPRDARDLGRVNGLTGGDTALIGIDHRPSTGVLYGVGNNGGVYTIDRAQATFVLRLTQPLQGTAFGVDFNPAADALRIVSDTGQNLRQPFAVVAPATAPGATVADAPLSTPPTAGATTGIVAAAYTNNDSDPATATTLYDLSAMTDQILIQSPANAGTLAPTGSLQVDAAGDAGFDIYSTLRNGSTVDLDAFAVLTVGGRTALYEITLFNGRADRVQDFRLSVTDLAIATQRR